MQFGQNNKKRLPVYCRKGMKSSGDFAGREQEKKRQFRQAEKIKTVCEKMDTLQSETKYTQQKRELRTIE